MTKISILIYFILLIQLNKALTLWNWFYFIICDYRANINQTD